MATQTIDPGIAVPVTEVRRSVYPFGPVRISWSAVFAGTITALGVAVLFYVLGMAIGLTSVNASANALKGSGIFTGVWSLIVPLIALFCGGIIAAFSASRPSRAEGVVHGIVVWGATSLVALFGTVSMLSAVVSTAGSVAKDAAGVVGGVAGGAVSQAFNLNASDALKPINDKLQADGKPAITEDQLKAATSDILKKAVANKGQLDKQELSQSIAQNTQLSQEDADDVANRVDQQYEQAKGKVQQTAQQAGETATKAANIGGGVFWGIFASMLLSLVSAVLGGLLGSLPRSHRSETAVVR
jgi:hypothetical protein